MKPVRNRAGKSDPTIGMSAQQKADYEKQHPRTAKGRVGGGQFAKKGDGMGGQPDEHVKEVQRQINSAGTGKVSVDGRFGPVTEEALKTFQRKAGVHATGAMDPNTREALRNPPPISRQEAEAQLKADAGSSRSSSSSGSGAAASGGSGGTLGRADAASRQAREEAEAESSSSRSRSSSRRSAGGSASSSRSGTGSSGSRGQTLDPSDVHSVEDFQREHGLKVDGVIGADTQRALRQENRRQDTARERRSTQRKQTSERRKADGSIRSGEGMTGEASEQVRQMQQMLADMGYDLGEVDGRFGPRTKEALRRAQDDYGLKGDGVYGKSSMKLLNRVKAKRASGGTARTADKGEVIAEAALAAGGLSESERTTMIEEADLSAKGRRRASSSGHAMADGSFPITTAADVKKAIQSVGRAPEGKRAAVKAHIKRRAKALGVSVPPSLQEAPQASSDGKPKGERDCKMPHEAMAKRGKNRCPGCGAKIGQVAKTEEAALSATTREVARRARERVLAARG